MTKLRDELITLAHGSGGKATHMLVEQLFLEELRNPMLEELGDAAVADGLAFTTDSFVVKPLFFPGGDIGELAVNGTVNDLAVAGAEPLWLSAGFVIEEGFPLGDLRRIARSMARAAERAGVAVVAGDTKVVERGSADGFFVTTAGVGRMRATFGQPQPGDRVLLSGTIGDHGFAVLVARGDLRFESSLESDTAPLNELAAALLELGPALRWMRDPTRGGLATALNELAPPTGSASGWTSRRSRSGPKSRARPRSSGSIRSTSPTRGSSSPSWRARPPRMRWRAVEHPLERSGNHRRGPSDEPGLFSSTLPSAAGGSSTCSSGTRCRESASRARLRRDSVIPRSTLPNDPDGPLPLTRDPDCVLEARA